jgi:TPR repeat protein
MRPLTWGHKRAHEVLDNFDTDCGEYRLEEAKRMLEMSAESGHILIQYKLGLLAFDIKSPYYNINNAAKWFKMASAGGYINAHSKLGLLL